MSEPTKTRDAELVQILRRAAFFSRNGNGSPAIADAFEMLAERFELEEELKQKCADSESKKDGIQ